ncbi:hypothetical protein COOONC_27016, partial [Cooperia oncophora]
LYFSSRCPRFTLAIFVFHPVLVQSKWIEAKRIFLRSHIDFLVTLELRQIMATEPTAGADTDTPPAEVTRTWTRLTEDRGVVSDEMMAELTELALEGDDEEEEEVYNRENASTVVSGPF